MNMFTVQLEDGVESFATTTEGLHAAMDLAEEHDSVVMRGEAVEFDPRECEDHDGTDAVDADAWALAGAGYGTDEDYGCFGDESFMGE